MFSSSSMGSATAAAAAAADWQRWHHHNLMRQNSGSLITHAQRDEGSLSTHRWHLYDNSNHFHTPMSFHTGLDYVQMDFSNHLQGGGGTESKNDGLDGRNAGNLLMHYGTRFFFFFLTQWIQVFFWKRERQQRTRLPQKREEGWLELLWMNFIENFIYFSFVIWTSAFSRLTLTHYFLHTATHFFFVRGFRGHN